MADDCSMQDAPGKELLTTLDMLEVALGKMAAISVEEKGPAPREVSEVVEHLRVWRRRKAILRMDGETAIRSLELAIQHFRDDQTGYRVSAHVFFTFDGSG